jgi:hypothetical protein
MIVFPVSFAEIFLGTIDWLSNSESKTPSAQPPFSGVARTVLSGDFVAMLPVYVADDNGIRIETLQR